MTRIINSKERMVVTTEPDVGVVVVGENAFNRRLVVSGRGNVKFENGFEAEGHEVASAAETMSISARNHESLVTEFVLDKPHLVVQKRREYNKAVVSANKEKRTGISGFIAIENGQEILHVVNPQE